MNSIDITREHCPMTMVKVKLALSRMSSGEELEVILAGEEPLNNIPRTAEEQGHTVLSTEVRGAFHRIVIRK